MESKYNISIVNFTCDQTGADMLRVRITENESDIVMAGLFEEDKLDVVDMHEVVKKAIGDLIKKKKKDPVLHRVASNDDIDTVNKAIVIPKELFINGAKSDLFHSWKAELDTNDPCYLTVKFMAEFDSPVPFIETRINSSDGRVFAPIEYWTDVNRPNIISGKFEVLVNKEEGE